MRYLHTMVRVSNLEESLEFYCNKLDAPLLAEVVRSGVTFARVYDIRGRSIRTLLTQPGL